VPAAGAQSEYTSTAHAVTFAKARAFECMSISSWLFG